MNVGVSQVTNVLNQDFHIVMEIWVLTHWLIFFSTCVETNSYIQDIDSITDVVQYQPHQHIPHLELIKTGPTETHTETLAHEENHGSMLYWTNDETLVKNIVLNRNLSAGHWSIHYTTIVGW